ncbi:MAG: hypothetical protein QME52_01755 [Bacteroidota bacterium]|nr:hypothetical protein [Bacteroidota bacterium]
MSKFRKILLCCLCLWLITDCLQANQVGERKSKSQKQGATREDKKIAIPDENQPTSSETSIKDNFQSLHYSLQQQDKNIERMSDQIRSSQDDLRILYYVSIGLTTLIILLLSFLIFILIRGKFHKLSGELTYLKNILGCDKKFNFEASRFLPQLRETLRNLDSDIKRIKEAVYSINDKIAESARPGHRENFPSRLVTLSNELSLSRSNTFEELKPQEESQIVHVKYIGEFASRQTFSRDTIPEYFYIAKQGGNWRLYVEENILAKRPSQEYEVLLTKFFEITKVPDPQRYELSESALIDWDESEGKGYFKAKGKIRQV